MVFLRIKATTIRVKPIRASLPGSGSPFRIVRTIPMRHHVAARVPNRFISKCLFIKGLSILLAACGENMGNRLQILGRVVPHSRGDKADCAESRF